MSGIDDWYLNRPQDAGVSPGHDWLHDDARRPNGFGEAPQREWTARSPRSRGAQRAEPTRSLKTRFLEEAVHTWFGRNRGRSYLDCARALAQSGHLGVTRADVARIMKRSEPAPKAGRARPRPVESPPVQPRSTGSKPVQAKRVKPKRGKAKRTQPPQPHPVEPYAANATRPGKWSYVPPPMSAEPVRIKYCESCGMAITAAGACRC